MRESIRQILKVSLVFVLLHSVTASRPAKQITERLVGARYRNGLYRLIYNAHSFGGLAWAFWRIARLPDRELFRVPAPLSWLMRAVQVWSLWIVFDATRVVGFPEFAGFPQLLSMIKGGDTVPEPEAQSPYPTADGRMSMEGPFGRTRHPSNWGFMIFFLFFPRVTVKGATVAVLNVLYSVLGSIHQDYRMLARYGDSYRQYMEEVPFMLPRAGKWPARRG